MVLFLRRLLGSTQELPCDPCWPGAFGVGHVLHGDGQAPPAVCSAGGCGLFGSLSLDVLRLFLPFFPSFRELDLQRGWSRVVGRYL